MGEVRIPAAGIRQHEDSRFADPLRLETERHCSFPLRKHRAEHGDANHRHNRRAVASDLPREPEAAGYELVWRHRADARRRPRHDVGDAEPELRQAIVVLEGEPLLHQAGFEEQRPEPIGEAGEVMPRQRRAHAGIDADEQHANVWPDAIAKPSHF